MARHFNNAAGTPSDYLFVASTPVTDYPFTMFAWFRPDDLTTDNGIFNISSTASSTIGASLEARGGNGDVVRARAGVTTIASLVSYSANVWSCVGASWLDETSTDLYFNGANKVNGALGSIQPPDSLTIGRLGDSSPSNGMKGRISDVALWNVTLTDEEHALLAAGISPLKIRPGSLVAYYPILGVSPEPDFSPQATKRAMTVTATTVVPGAPVIPYRRVDLANYTENIIVPVKKKKKIQHPIFVFAS